MSFGEVKAQLDSLLTKGIINDLTYEHMTESHTLAKSYFTDEEIINVADVLKRIIIDEIDASNNLTDNIKGALFRIINHSETDIAYGDKYEEVDDDWRNSVVVTIKFKDNDLQRQSMFDTLEIYGGRYGGHTGEGINNLMALFNNGAVNGSMGAYHLNTTIGSVEEGDALSHNYTYYPPLHFLQRAVDRFNHDFSGYYLCIAELGDAYLA